MNGSSNANIVKTVLDCGSGAAANDCVTTTNSSLEQQQQQQEQLLISDEALNLVYWIVTSILCGAVSLFGIVTNSINMAVFVSLGFNDTVNISLFSLAVSDLCSLITLFWCAVCFNPEFHFEDLSFFPVQVYHLTGGWPHVLFVRISGWILAFVAFERFLCIALPLRVKDILTTMTVRIIIICIYTVVLMSAVPIYYASRLAWTFVPSLNRSMLALAFTEDREEVEGVAITFNNIISATGSFCLVAVFTAAIVIQLKQKSRARKNLGASTQDKQESLTARDNKLAKMMVAVSSIFIICFTPTLINSTLMVFLPAFSVSGPFGNMYSVAFSFSFLLEGVNSSINIFVYYHMSSRYKERLSQMWSTISR